MRILTALLCSLLVQPVLAEVPTPLLRVTSVAGEVSHRIGGTAPIGIPLRTGNTGFLRFEYNFMPVRGLVYPNTELSIDSVSLGRAGARITNFRLDGRNNKDGQADFQVGVFYNPATTLNIITKQGIYQYKGTESRIQTNGDASILGVSKGAVNSSAQGITFRIKAGYWNRIKTGMPPEPPQPILPAESYTVSKPPSAGYVEVTLPPGNQINLGVRVLENKVSIPLYTEITSVTPDGKQGIIKVTPGGLDWNQKKCPTRSRVC